MKLDRRKETTRNCKVCGSKVIWNSANYEPPICNKCRKKLRRETANFTLLHEYALNKETES